MNSRTEATPQSLDSGCETLRVPTELLGIRGRFYGTAGLDRRSSVGAVALTGPQPEDAGSEGACSTGTKRILSRWVSQPFLCQFIFYLSASKFFILWVLVVERKAWKNWHLLSEMNYHFLKRVLCVLQCPHQGLKRVRYEFDKFNLWYLFCVKVQFMPTASFLHSLGMLKLPCAQIQFMLKGSVDGDEVLH